jgi:hypothetical protein
MRLFICFLTIYIHQEVLHLPMPRTFWIVMGVICMFIAAAQDALELERKGN